MPYDPAIPLLGVYPREPKRYVHTKTCTQMFIAALFIIVKRWKQPKYPPTYEWINKMYVHIMEHYSAIKRNEVLTHVTTWMNLENIMLSERSQDTKGHTL